MKISMLDSGAGGPLVHAERTLSGYMGGIRGTDTPPTLLVTASQAVHAVVEGDTFNADGDDKCPSYTDLRVTPRTPPTLSLFGPASPGPANFQVHPVGSGLVTRRWLATSGLTSGKLNG